MPRVLLLLPNSSYRTDDFLHAIRALDLDVTVATDQASTMQALSPDGLITLDFAEPRSAARTVAAFAAHTPIVAVLGVDDESAETAAVIAEGLGLRSNSAAAARAARDKSVSRALLAEAGLPVPWFRRCRFDEAIEDWAATVPLPCVIKPLFLSGSRGVMRADAGRTKPVGFSSPEESTRCMRANAARSPGFCLAGSRSTGSCSCCHKR